MAMLVKGLLAAIAVFFLGCPLNVHAGQSAGGTGAKTLTLGVVAETNQRQVEDHFRDFARYVGKKLTGGAVTEGKIAAAPSQARLARLLTERRVDFYLESAYPTYLINSVYGAGKLLLRRWKGGQAEYRGLILTHRSGASARLEELRGKLIAFEDPGSTSGYYLPKFFLSKRGFKLAQKGQIGAAVASGEVGYVFAYSQERLLEWVLAQQVAAGAFSNDDYDALDDKKKSDLTILAETDNLPRHLVSVRKDLPPL